MEKLDNKQEQMENVIREMKILRNNRNQNFVTEMKNVFDGPVSRQHGNEKNQ